MSKSVLRLLWWALLCAALVGATASGGAAKTSKPGRISASFDFVRKVDCEWWPGMAATTGHVEILAYDDDQTPVLNSWDRQNDRVSMTITFSDGQTFSPDLLGVAVREDGSSASLIDGTWQVPGYTLYDGGNPGSGQTGELYLDLPVTLDSMSYKGFSICTASYFLTSGNIKITSGG